MNVKYYQCDITKKFNISEKFDLIYSSTLLQYFDRESHKKMVKNLTYLCKEKVKIAHMSIPNKIHYFRYAMSDYTHGPIKLMLKYPILLFKYITGATYAENGWWWNVGDLKNDYCEI